MGLDERNVSPFLLYIHIEGVGCRRSHHHNSSELEAADRYRFLFVKRDLNLWYYFKTVA